MAKIIPKQIPLKDRLKILDEFYLMVAALEGREEVKNFLKDLLTESESLMLARRIQIAKMLIRGVSYEQIRRDLGVGIDNIRNVQHWLEAGFGGYLKAIQKGSKKSKKKEKEIIEPFSFKSLRRKYPLHFLLINALDK